MFAMDLVSALDAQVQRWRTVRGIGNAYVVVVADFNGFGIARIGTGVSLAREGHQVI